MVMAFWSLVFVSLDEPGDAPRLDNGEGDPRGAEGADEGEEEDELLSSLLLLLPPNQPPSAIVMEGLIDDSRP